MAHNLNFKDGKASIFFVGETPWHGLGTKLDNPATSEEAIVAAGLNWNVEKKRIYFDGSTEPIEDHFAVVRTDVNQSLGVVGDRYTPLQNKNAFNFFDAIVGEKAAMYHLAGALGKGEKIWLLAKLPGEIRVTKDDVVDKYLLLHNSHNGSSSVEIMFSPIRVCCANTLNIAVREATNISKVRHTSSMLTRVDDVKQQLGIVHNAFSIMEHVSQKMVKVQLNQQELHTYLEKIGLITDEIKTEDQEKSIQKMLNRKELLTSLFEHGKGNDLPGVKGTLWAGFNAVTEYVDYCRGGDKTRTESLLFGSGQQIKQLAWNRAVEMMK